MSTPSYPTYIITQEPGMVPLRKGPFYGDKMIEGFLRDAYHYNPDIICIVIDMETADNTWYPEHGYEWLDINGDGRKRHPRKDRQKREAARAQGTDVHPDDLAVDRFAADMKSKLAHKREQGRGGWDNPDECTVEFLSELLRDHVVKGDPVDVANFAMMIHQRGAAITTPPTRA